MKKLLSVLLTLFLFHEASTQISCTIANPALIFCLPFDGNANDESGNGFNGTVSGAQLSTDKWGNQNSCYNFNGISNFIDLPKSLPEKDSITLSFWFKPQAGSARNYIFWEGDNECGNDYAVYITDNIISVNASKLNKPLDGNTTTSGLYNLSVPLTNDWHCFIWTMTPFESKVYLDCSLLASFQKAGSNKGHHSMISLGSMNDGGGGNCGSIRHFFYKGLLDNVRAYGKLLSGTELTQLCCPSEYASKNSHEEKITVYPNYIIKPNSIIVNAIIENIDIITITDLSGKEIASYSGIAGSVVKLPTGGLISGLYLVTIRTKLSVLTQRIFIAD
jgi:hypothetical protein